MADSWHTQNIQINKITGENEKNGPFILWGKIQWIFWPTQWVPCPESSPTKLRKLEYQTTAETPSLEAQKVRGWGVRKKLSTWHSLGLNAGQSPPPEPPPARRCPVPKAAEALSAVWGHLQEGWGQTCQLEPFLPNYTRSWTRPLCFSALLFVYCWYNTWFYILRSNWHTTLS